MADKLVFIPIDDTQNYLFCRLQSMGETSRHSTNQKSIKAPGCYKTFETSIISSQMSPPSLEVFTFQHEDV